MFEQAFRNIDDALRKEAGCTTELDYTEQTSWLLFLEYLDGLEQDKADEAAIAGKKYSYILDKPYRWESWATPKGKDGKLDHNAARTGPDLCELVDRQLFPYLQAFKQKATGPNTIEYEIGEIFGEIKNRIQSKRVEIFMGEINQREKTLVFCATQNHALAVRDLINQMKTSHDPNYCQRVTTNDGELDEQHLEQRRSRRSAHT